LSIGYKQSFKNWNMRTVNRTVKQSFIVLAMLLISVVTGCKKSATIELNSNSTDIGCNSATALQTLNNTPCQLVYAASGPFAGDWLIVTDYGCSRSYSCLFCDKTAYSSIVAGKPESTPINITVTGSIKRRIQNQEPINQTSGGYETYLISVSSIQ
jgi:hypothetical protein